MDQETIGKLRIAGKNQTDPNVGTLYYQLADLAAENNQQQLLIEDLRTTAFKHNDQFDELVKGLELFDEALGREGDSLHAIAERLDYIQTNGSPKSARRRIKRGITAKGIIQIEGTVETTGMSQEEHDAEVDKMEASIVSRQPIYEEFVEPSVGATRLPFVLGGGPTTDESDEPEEE